MIERATVADGTAPLSEQAVRAIRATEDDAHVLALLGGTVVGYATVERGSHDEDSGDDSADGGPMAEAVVDPDHRGRGVGTALVDRALAPPIAGIWAHGQLPAAEHVATALDLVVVRRLSQMRRPTAEPLPTLVIPDDIVVRTYRESDDAELLRVNNAAFVWHPEQGGWTQSEIDARRAESWFDPEGLFVATSADDPETVLGFHWTKVHAADAEPAIGEVYVVGIDPSAQGRGLGRILTLAGLRHLAELGLPAVMLYVESDNEAAVHTYDRLGFTNYHVDAVYARRS